MAEVLERAPVCDITGLPLPILPLELAERRALLNFKEIQGLKTYEDFHHMWFHDSAPELEGLLGRAQRSSYGQDINRSLHDRFTNRVLQPILPTEDKVKYHRTVDACAGIIPRKAVFMPKEGGILQVELTDEEYTYLASKVHIEKHFHPKHHSSKRRLIGRAFATYLVDQNIEGVVSKKVVGEFLSKKTSAERKLVLGNQILSMTIWASVDELQPVYRELSREGFVRKEKVAPNLGKVVRSFFTKDYFSAYHREMTEKLLTTA